jgi:small ligand-binding sensory domain FIST
MTAAGSGLAVGTQPATAALDAALEAMAAAGSDRADLVLVFVTGETYRAAHEMLHAVRRVTGARVVVGASGAGVLCERREVEGDLAVAVLAVRDERLVATPFLVPDQAAAGADIGRAVAAQVSSTVAEGGCVFALPDVAGFQPSALFEGLEAELGRVPIVGAVAAGTPMFELYATDARRGALPGIALSGPRPIIGVAQGCTPIGEPYVVTRADGNVVLEIGSRPALAVLREAVSSIPGGTERAQRAGIFAGLAVDPAKSPLGRGDFLVRNLVGADPSAGAIAVADAVHVGQTLQFHVRDAAASREDLDITLTRVMRALDGRRPAFGCYFDCAGRGQGLYGVPDHDIALIRKHLGIFPLAGFFGNGELAPVGARNFFHTYTGVLVVFPA